MRSKYALLLLFLLLMVFRTEAQPVFNPLHHSNMYPMFFPVMTEVLKPLPLNDSEWVAVQWSSMYTTMNYFLENGVWSSGIDMEHALWRADVAVSLTERVQFRFMVPVHMKWDGFMDPFLIWYHDVLGLPNYGREDRPNNEFAFYLDKEGDRVLSSRKNTVLISDPLIGFIADIYRNETSRLQYGVHFSVPLGSVNRAMSNGSPGFGMSLHHVMGKNVWNIYTQGAIIYPGRGGELADINREYLFTYLLSAEYQLNTTWSLLSQMSGNSGLYTNLGLKHQEVPSLEFVNGLRRTAPSGEVTIGLSEDFTYTAPDFTLFVNWRMYLKNRN